MQSTNKSEAVHFSPIYDTSRGLFWNDSDIALRQKTVTNAEFKRYFYKYAEGSRSKTGWEQLDSPNHFQLIEKLCQLDKAEVFLENFREPTFPKWKSLLISEFSPQISQTRFKLILHCLEYRCNRIDRVLKTTLP